MTFEPDHVLIFTDLDGTVLDHDSYSPTPADRFIAELDPERATVIPVTSKTRAEVAALLWDIAPLKVYVTENGSAIHAPDGFPWAADSESQIHFPGMTHEQILSRLESAEPQLRSHFRGFSDMTAKQIAAETGLDLQRAYKAKAREASEPFLWTGSAANLDRFRDVMGAQGLKIQRGGRFCHLTGPCGKADAMDWIVSHYKSSRPDRRIMTVALGDGPNDLDMIESADRGVIIPNPGGAAIRSDRSSVITAAKAGPEGWVEVMQQILDKPDSANDRKH
ncbi:mannosyl-3-phosphoglycerate phosphatase [Parasphingorhabdus marina DSM 22363]|uniref:Mannosyl-3-phosphoglycerate phosphatase n=1 Tax=Parasphingorhabdus marina DSM 22363 TaxID=1123272 RepID=A0A1N6H4A7_9SPHN|nr:HAD-IIB family hydrolase [Parasphingorhabdus marina]SIO14599.1 mannosyl-3-phosphoglycerate phosphatase [Parasphingorhabdus marina DSM 22363]